MTAMLAENLGRAWTDRLNARRAEAVQILKAPALFRPEHAAQVGADMQRAGDCASYFGRQFARESAQALALADPFFADEIGAQA